MQPIDWALVVVGLAGLLAVTLYSRRYLRSVADFVAGGRLARRYLLANAAGETAYGLITLVATYELIYQAGWTNSWWAFLTTPVGLMVALLGFVTYRFRETRAMTLAQFFEMRYSRRFRMFAGVLGFTAGLVNSAIIPAIVSKFLVTLLQIPETMHFGPLAVPTFALIMMAYLACSVVLATTGGKITLLTTNCLEGILSHFLHFIVVIGLLGMFTWGQMRETLLSRGPGESLVNPFDTSKVPDFNWSWALIGVVIGVYTTMANGFGSGGIGAVALSPHEARMAGIIGRWRDFSRQVMLSLLALCALVFLHHHDFAAQAAPVHDALSRLGTAMDQHHARMPLTVSYLLPAGIKGVFCVIVLWILMATDPGFLHNQASVFVQDVILPLRGKHFDPKTHIRWLRWAIVGVAATVFTTSLIMKATDYLILWWAMVAAIYMAGAGSAVIGGLYWQRGTTAGAWAAMITGASLAGGALIYTQITGVRLNIHDHVINGQIISVIASAASVLMYITVSLLTGRERFNLQRMLHRGQYAVAGEVPTDPQPTGLRRFRLATILNFDHNFTRGDKIIAGGIFFWTIGWFAIAAISSIWYFIRPWPATWWATFWLIHLIIIPITLGIVTTIWLTWGGIRDLRDFFRRLREERVDTHDDGTVTKEPEDQGPRLG